MKKTAYGKPILISNNSTQLLERVEVENELTIQELVFENPSCLPISDIDEAYNPLIPICQELNTAVGPLDILMITPTGDLAIIETKLWRNPEARRKVVAQILDYAKELSSWRYEDLQREVNRKLGKKGNSLYQIATQQQPDLTIPEADFVDSVSRNLLNGSFLLLIVGDGIREGAAGIAEFLSGTGNMHYSFAMVELSVYQAKELGRLVIPKTLVKTVEISRMTVELPTGFSLIEKKDRSTIEISAASISPERQKEKDFYEDFWVELISELDFDDPSQPLPKASRSQNLFIYPAETKKAWISAYFMKSNNRVGVYFRVQNDQEGNRIYEALNSHKEGIRNELGDEIIWSWDQNADVGVRKPCEAVFAPEHREELKDFFKQWLNTFVNVFRPRLKRIG